MFITKGSHGRSGRAVEIALVEYDRVGHVAGTNAGVQRRAERSEARPLEHLVRGKMVINYPAQAMEDFIDDLSGFECCIKQHVFHKVL